VSVYASLFLPWLIQDQVLTKGSAESGRIQLLQKYIELTAHFRQLNDRTILFAPKHFILSFML